MSVAIKTSIDAAGRLVVPKAVREEAGLFPGVELEIRCDQGRVEIEPVPREVRLVRRGKVLVAEPVTASSPLTAATVRDTQRALRHRKVET